MPMSPQADTRRNLALLTVMLAFVLDIADSTIVNTALPAIQQELSASNAAAQWMVAGYFLSFSVFLVAGGRLGDLFGYRRLFLAGVAAFTLASLGCGMAQSADQLVACRVAQGCAAALMGPQVMAVVQVLFSPTERIAKLAWFGTLGGIAAVLGPIVGGLLIAANPLGLGWRAVFLINLPIGVIALAAGARFLPDARSPDAQGLDLGGTALLGTGLVALLVPMVQGPELGWPAWTLALLGAVPVIAVLALAHARARGRVGKDRLIEPTLFHERAFTLGLSASVCFSAGVSGFVLVFALAVQLLLARSPLDTALLLAPFGVGVSLGIAFVGRKLLPRLGKWIPFVGASAMALLGASVLLLVPTAPPTALLAVLLVPTGLAMGMVAGPLTPIALARVRHAHAGIASGMLKTAQQVGGALGAAVVGGAWFAGHGTTIAAVVLAAILGAAALCAAALPRSLFGSTGEQP
ncbi:MFS transporter [Novosphingobium olei]|uniref:MFS transporter n=1 Tax=Novosphingobium olei TaxID=2728851 RepID=UPI003086B1D3|nr:MFS transporter [Novosphingobium olei]